MTLATTDNVPRRRLLATKGARRTAIEVVVLFVVAGLAVLLVANLLDNLAAGGVRFGFAFLGNVAGFDVNESFLPYTSASSYLMALAVGALNTLHLTLVCIFFSTAIGVLVGLLQLSDIRVFGIACRIYVDAMRNLPKLLILLAVYVLLVVELPVAREAISVFDVAFLSNRGVHLPSLAVSADAVLSPGGLVFTISYLAACAILWTALRTRLVGPSRRIVLPIGLAAFGWALGSGAVTVEVPVFAGFNFEGGAVVSLPFLALTIALSVYHGAQVAEVVRGGISSVPKGQPEAGRALGLSQGNVFWLVVMPQAMRVMIPPLANQYLNILKNTSIGLAVGYSDLVSVMNTAINQTFRPVELMLVTMSVYLVIGLVASLILNWFNRRVQLKER